jgi:purine-nucleoside phosphorylase
VTTRITRDTYERAADIIRTQYSSRPRIGLILGSGLNAVADIVNDVTSIPYDRIPNFPWTTVEGHIGRLVFGTLEGQSVVLMQGRTHYYEGVSMQQIAFPVRVLQVLGIEMLIVTNAAGAINQSFQVGDLMLIVDHIGLSNMAGLNPLRGPNDPTFGPRFPDMTRAYDPELRSVALQVAEETGIPLRQGIYAGVAGPSFETPAELRFLRAIGADAVGMSTVPEVIVARHCGLRVIGISGISNIAILDPSENRQASHEEVLIAGKQVSPRLITLICGILRRLH